MNNIKKNPSNNARKLKKAKKKKKKKPQLTKSQSFNTQNKLTNKNGAQTFYGVSRE
jgi:hypothetical protein